MDLLIYCQCTRTKCVKEKIGLASFCSRLLKRSVGGGGLLLECTVTKKSVSYIFKRFNILIP